MSGSKDRSGLYTTKENVHIYLQNKMNKKIKNTLTFNRSQPKNNNILLTKSPQDLGLSK